MKRFLPILLLVSLCLPALAADNLKEVQTFQQLYGNTRDIPPYLQVLTFKGGTAGLPVIFLNQAKIDCTDHALADMLTKSSNLVLVRTSRSPSEITLLLSSTDKNGAWKRAEVRMDFDHALALRGQSTKNYLLVETGPGTFGLFPGTRNDFETIKQGGLFGGKENSFKIVPVK